MNTNALLRSFLQWAAEFSPLTSRTGSGHSHIRVCGPSTISIALFALLLRAVSAPPRSRQQSCGTTPSTPATTAATHGRHRRRHHRCRSCRNAAARQGAAGGVIALHHRPQSRDSGRRRRGQRHNGAPAALGAAANQVARPAQGRRPAGAPGACTRRLAAAQGRNWQRRRGRAAAER